MFVFVVLLVYDIVVNIVLKKVNLSWNVLNCKGVLVLIRTDLKVFRNWCFGWFCFGFRGCGGGGWRSSW